MHAPFGSALAMLDQIESGIPVGPRCATCRSWFQSTTWFLSGCSGQGKWTSPRRRVCLISMRQISFSTRECGLIRRFFPWLVVISIHLFFFEGVSIHLGSSYASPFPRLPRCWWWDYDDRTCLMKTGLALEVPSRILLSSREDPRE
jgi:hypothetical protein